MLPVGVALKEVLGSVEFKLKLMPLPRPFLTPPPPFFGDPHDTPSSKDSMNISNRVRAIQALLEDEDVRGREREQDDAGAG